MYYRTCSICNSNLDPNEKCDCETKKETNPSPRERPLSKTSKVSLSVPPVKVNKVRGCLNG